MTDQNEIIQTEIDLKQLEEKQRIEQAYQKMIEEQKNKKLQLYGHLIKVLTVLFVCLLGFYLYQIFEQHISAKTNGTTKDQTEQEQKKVNLSKEVIYELREVRMNKLPDLSDDRFQKKDGVPIFHKNTLKKLNPNLNQKQTQDDDQEDESQQEEGQE
jgi:hypothetical protein